MDDDDLTQSWEGRGQHLHDALDDAWNNAKKNGAEPGRYVVQYVAIEAENPIRTYIVIIGPGE
jgi:hypothetical protein